MGLYLLKVNSKHLHHSCANTLQTKIYCKKFCDYRTFNMIFLLNNKPVCLLLSDKGIVKGAPLVQASRSTHKYKTRRTDAYALHFHTDLPWQKRTSLL